MWRVGVVVAVAFAAFAAQAQAATFTVGATDDGAGCASPPSGTTCTLRQLVNNVPAGSTIIVPANTYSLTNGELSIAQNMTIQGAGARTTEIDQQTSAANARIFDVQPGVTATISGLDTIFGKTTSTSTNGNFGGNILNRGTLTLSEDWIELAANDERFRRRYRERQRHVDRHAFADRGQQQLHRRPGRRYLQRDNRGDRELDDRQLDDRQQHGGDRAPAPS